MAMLTAKDLIALYHLKPHPEGGYYQESYRATGEIPQAVLPQGFLGDRSYATAIYFLLSAGAKSALHRLASDEMWHFYLGDPLSLVQLSPEGHWQTIILGNDVLSGQSVQCVVPAGYWFGATPSPGASFSFVGCTVSPGFDFEDFEMASFTTLIKQFPALENELLSWCLPEVRL